MKKLSGAGGSLFKWSDVSFTKDLKDAQSSENYGKNEPSTAKFQDEQNALSEWFSIVYYNKWLIFPLYYIRGIKNDSAFLLYPVLWGTCMRVCQ